MIVQTATETPVQTATEMFDQMEIEMFDPMETEMFDPTSFTAAVRLLLKFIRGTHTVKQQKKLLRKFLRECYTSGLKPTFGERFDIDKKIFGKGGPYNVSAYKVTREGQKRYMNGAHFIAYDVGAFTCNIHWLNEPQIPESNSSESNSSDVPYQDDTPILTYMDILHFIDVNQ